MREHQDLDLIVWPETMFREPLRSYTPDVRPPEGIDWTKADLRMRDRRTSTGVKYMGERYKVPMLLGMDTLVYGAAHVDRYNSAVLVSPNGEVEGRYDKVRPIMFGEYIPLGQLFSLAVSS